MNGVNTGSWFKNEAKHKDIEHSSTVVVCSNEMEKSYVLKWCEIKGSSISESIVNNDRFPLCLSVYGYTVGFLHEMDRALYYMTFNEFKEKAEPKNENT